MHGYFDEKEETQKAIDEDGWLRTGDIAAMDSSGYLRITDRIKDMYIMGGFNCYPAEIEKALFDSGLVSQVAVSGVPDERMGEVRMAFVIPSEKNKDDISEEQISEWCRLNMANYKVPRRIKIVDSLPSNAMGKVTKFALREQASH